MLVKEFVNPAQFRNADAIYDLRGEGEGKAIAPPYDFPL